MEIGECIPYLANGKGTRDEKSTQFVQPAGLIAKRRTLTELLRAISLVDSCV